ncbi:MAG TPA: anti-sigma factor antagonist [Crocinitomix sp.]|nr:anti-sigma factor antagonist [Crocinitomix sp.]
MSFTITDKQKYILITSNVEKLDASNAPDLKSELVLLNKNGVNKIVLDLSLTKYCDSSGLSAILIGNRLCKDSSGVFVILGLQPNVKKLIQISQLDKVLSITSDLKSVEKMLD